MNKYAKRLISFLLLEPRTKEVEVVIGYIDSIKNTEFLEWPPLLELIINLDLSIVKLLSNNLVESKLKSYSFIFNNIYKFINDEYAISFLQSAPFNNQRVASIRDYNIYILARETNLNEYKINKENSKR